MMAAHFDSLTLLRHLAFAACAAAAIGLPACATSEIVGCESALDCATGQICEESVCTDITDRRDTGSVDARDNDAGDADDDTGELPDTGTTDTGTTDTTPTDTGNTDTAPTDTGNTDTGPTDTGNDVGPADTSDAADIGQEDVTFQTCSSQGARCSLNGVSIRDDGDFYCVNLTDQPTPICTMKCGEDFTQDVCPAASYCLEVTGDEPFNMCLPAECDSWEQSASQCDSGTCVQFSETYGQCFNAGVVPNSGACRVPAETDADRCDVGMFCDLPDADATIGSCRQLCDPFDGRNCPDSQDCGFLTESQGMCQPSEQLGPYNNCPTPGNVCSNRSVCLTFTFTDDTTQDLCGVYCRPGMNDCNGILAFSQTTVCDADAVADPNLGLCLPPPA